MFEKKKRRRKRNRANGWSSIKMNWNSIQKPKFMAIAIKPYATDQPTWRRPTVRTTFARFQRRIKNCNKFANKHIKAVSRRKCRSGREDEVVEKSLKTNEAVSCPEKWIKIDYMFRRVWRKKWIFWATDEIPVDPIYHFLKSTSKLRRFLMNLSVWVIPQ